MVRGDHDPDALRDSWLQKQQAVIELALVRTTVSNRQHIG
jgi:hypothetical protein